MRPYSRGEFNQALIANALLSPFNVLLLTGILVAGLVLDLFLPLLPVAVIAYGIAAARTYLDEDEANKVLERERKQRRKEIEKGRLNPASLAPPIRALLEGALQRERTISDAISRAQLPYEEVSAEVERFVRAMEDSAGRAQLLYEGLVESPPPQVEQRLAQVKGDPSKADLTQALESQLTVLRRMELQLQRFYSEMERVLVELDTVRGNIVSVSASTESANQQRLAADVRGLREEVGAVAEGMSEAYEEPQAPAG
jgi:hypothetical protein